MEYNKLVRDKIPEIIEKDGFKPKTRIASEKEYEESLKKKLREEVEEFLEDGKPEEIADILEVLYSIAKTKGFTKDGLENIRKKKAQNRGSFDRRIILESTSKS